MVKSHKLYVMEVLIILWLVLACTSCAKQEEVTIELANGSRLIIEIELWDRWEELYQNSYYYVPPGSDDREHIYDSIGKPDRKIRTNANLDFRDLDVPLGLIVRPSEFFTTGELKLFRPNKQKSNEERICVRTSQGVWMCHKIDESSFGQAAVWKKDLSLIDENFIGSKNVSRYDLSRMEIVVLHTGLWRLRELTFHLDPSGKNLELVKVERHPGLHYSRRSLAEQGNAWETKRILDWARKAFIHAKVQNGSGEIEVREVRVVNAENCSDDSLDRLYIYFEGSGKPFVENRLLSEVQQFSEVWRFKRSGDWWAFAEILLEDSAVTVHLITREINSNWDRFNPCFKII